MILGGYSALAHLMQNRLDKVIDAFPACDQVAELTTLNKRYLHGRGLWLPICQ
jgi:hypothetical protein